VLPASNPFDRKLFGVELFKVDHFFRYYVYKLLGLTLPKLREQKSYWKWRGDSYMDDFLKSGFADREVFFQNMLVDYLRGLDFSSFFEAGCGFGWNLRRVKEAFPHVRVGGLDFSPGQLANAQHYLKGLDIKLSEGDNCAMPFPDDFFDVGFSLGVFMNIHPDKIRAAAREMVRVSKKYIIHIEYDEDHTSAELREKRRIKRNVVSHDYPTLYRELGQKVIHFSDHTAFGEAYHSHIRSVTTEFTRWQAFEGPEKYIFVVVEVA
jgi:ubiquinone/menaquinone biosynthesis C-methylase UbiE